MSMARAAIRAVRRQPLVLGACVAALRLMRLMGMMRGRKFYSHVPYLGLVNVESGAGRFSIRSRGHNIENALYWDGLSGHEPKTMEAWVGQAMRANVVLDVGANSGVFGLAAAAAGAKAVHAFEPLPRVYGILAENYSLNSFPSAKAWPLAVGEKSGTAIIYDPGGDAPTSASLSEGFVRKHFGDVPGVEVSVVSIDDFCRTNSIGKVDLIKIDVEGYEKFALRGMQQTVAEYQPTILMEVLEGHEDELRGEVEALWPGRYDWKPIDEGVGFVSRNVLLCPKPENQGLLN